MKDFERIRAIKRAAQGRLLGIPGVHAVGIGSKIVGGKTTDEPAIIVFVVKKRPPSELPPKDVIPAEIEGVKTDVFESDIPRGSFAGPNPQITSIVPSSLIMKKDTLQQPTVNGSGFQDGLSVAITSPSGANKTISGSSIVSVTPGSFQMQISLDETGWYSMQVKNPDGGTSPIFNFSAEDTEDYSPHFVGGIQIMSGGFTKGSDDNSTPPVGMGAAGTLGCFATSSDANPKVFAITCHHVVGNPIQGQPTQVKAAVTNSTISFTGSNTPNTLIEVEFGVGGVPQEAFYLTASGDALGSIATQVAAQITALIIVGVTATPTGNQVTVTSSPLSLDYLVCHVFGPAVPDPKADIRASVAGTTISLSGTASRGCGAYVNLNLGGKAPTFGIYVEIAEKAAANSVASSIASAITSAAQTPANKISGVTATQTGATVQIANVQMVQCNITRDNRVGQPTNSFCSKCSACCGDRIGVVFDTKIGLDVGLIQMDSKLKYRAEIQGIGVIKGPLDITTKSSGYALQKRGARTGLTHGTLLALDQTGVIADDDPFHNPPQWSLFSRVYDGAFSVKWGQTPFGIGGDSGSAIVSDVPNSDPDNNKVAGILFGHTDNHTVATPITSILAAYQGLQLAIATATQSGVDQVVPPFPAHAAAMQSPQPASGRPAPELISPALLEMEREISATPAGRLYGELVQRHFPEVQLLVNTNRRVATVWHRNGGPRIVSALLRVANSFPPRLPAEIEGRPLGDCLKNIQNVFATYGSPQLSSDLRQHGPAIARLAQLSYPEALSELRLLKTDQPSEYLDAR